MPRMRTWAAKSRFLVAWLLGMTTVYKCELAT